MNSILNKFPLLILIALIGACQSQVEKVTHSGGNKFEDPEVVKIYNFIDKRDADSLIGYLRHENELYRYEATLGFGSIQDTSVLNSISFNLNDNSARVRKAAAYALGQSSDSSAVAPLFQALEIEDSVFVRKELLEALGKVVTQADLRKLQYWPLKTQVDKQGLAWGLYRAGVRNVHDGVSVDLALSLLDASNNYLTRLGAVHFLSRTRNLELADRNAIIIRTALSDSSVNVRMACALALRNAKHPTSIDALGKMIDDQDYRVKVNALRALNSFENNLGIVWTALSDSNQHVANTAAGIIRSSTEPIDLEKIRQSISQTTFNSVKSTLYGILLKNSEDKASILDEVYSIYNNTDDNYIKAQLLSALSSSPLAQEFVVTKTFSEQSLIVRSAGIGAIATMRNLPDFPDELEGAFAEVFKEAIETKDIAMIATAARVITNPEYNFKKHYDSASFLNEVRNQLELPKDIEAIQMLDRAIAFFDSTSYEAPQNEYNHPINWDLVKSLGKETSATITTTKGDIVMRLFTEDAPGSVSNFVSLSREGYYNGKTFHRVVPNFVIQGGCNRGDGYGGENYSIRSEFAKANYEEGSVGMASAGKDTEGTQWFITHSPTPHLDGGYAIFAKVETGMEVVQSIEVGDVIQSVTIN